MNQKRIGLYQFLGWGLLISYDVWWRGFLYTGPASRGHIMLLVVTFWLSLLVLFYYCLLLVFPQGIRRGRWGLLVLGLLGTPVVFAGTRYGLEEGLLPLLFGLSNYSPDTTLLYYLVDNLYFLIPTVALAAVTWSVQEAFSFREKERENQLQFQELQQQKTQAELAFLKTQINPHFLYNTLNYIYSLAYPVSEPLAEAVLKLSALMRYMLQESPDGQVAVQNEVDYLENYLSIYRLRFENNFFVNFDVRGHLNGQRVAALVLVPFVENAIKHGITDKSDRPVEITLHLRPDNGLTFEVRNHINQHQKDATTGIGLANIRRRLELLYPGRHELAIHNNGTVHHARLELLFT
ncbi:sensor histidine kinase [Hymenobacter arizonensis]|uniref:Histidine kinase n=1 Tax=Hymenobacter arizonensis TaxID=1227077 RepID=A0A1I5X4T8_HYMAR|nr:histidine kinase [Hymenobacter arizonensis]SFQ26989.1 Histidine kinase [Hymenobacter arizonensis]